MFDFTYTAEYSCEWPWKSLYHRFWDVIPPHWQDISIHNWSHHCPGVFISLGCSWINWRGWPFNTCKWHVGFWVCLFWGMCLYIISSGHWFEHCMVDIDWITPISWMSHRLRNNSEVTSRQTTKWIKTSGSPSRSQPLHVWTDEPVLGKGAQGSPIMSGDCQRAGVKRNIMRSCGWGPWWHGILQATFSGSYGEEYRLVSWPD